MKKRIFSSALLAMCLTGGIAQAQSKPDADQTAKDLVITVFDTVDADSNDLLTVEEISEMSESIFVSMDGDDNSEITHEEFMAWDFGLMYISAEAGEEQAFAAAKNILFALRDLNADGLIDEKEQRLNVMSDFERADIDNDAAISQPEYLTSFTPTLVFKAALKRKDD